MNSRINYWNLKKYIIKFNKPKIKFKWEYVVQNLYVRMKQLKIKIIVYQNIDEETRVVNIIESFEKSSPKKMPIRQLR